MTERHIPYSMVERRSFLGRMSAIVGAVFFAQVVLPLWRYLFPGMSREPDKVEFTEDMLAQLNTLEPGECLRFQWGGVPGLALRARDGELRVFKGVCTHADCNVAWRSETNDFFCACHEGRYDEFGKNIEGPPPRPLTRLFVEFTGDPAKEITELTVWRSESVQRKEGEGA
ncbi:MAG: ubiquinol-cytochrome c reductase iron-sulfur subunit [Phycisphaerae bacterium]|nr:ubiquinol-cytochrome c reductase iron-sulfur subunit [Phycisphaerae bacterium]